MAQNGIPPKTSPVGYISLALGGGDGEKEGGKIHNVSGSGLSRRVDREAHTCGKNEHF